MPVKCKLKMLIEANLLINRTKISKGRKEHCHRCLFKLMVDQQLQHRSLWILIFSIIHHEVSPSWMLIIEEALVTVENTEILSMESKCIEFEFVKLVSSP